MSDMIASFWLDDASNKTATQGIPGKIRDHLLAPDTDTEDTDAGIASGTLTRRSLTRLHRIWVCEAVSAKA